MFLAPDEVLRIIKFHLGREIWKRSCNLNYATFAKLVELPDLNSSEYSRILKAKASGDVRAVLALPEVQKRLADRMGVGIEVFKLSEPGIVRHLATCRPDMAARLASINADEPDTLIVPEALAASSIGLHPVEESAVVFLANTITGDQNGKVVSWSSKEPSGAFFFAYAVAGTYLPVGTKTYMVRPYPHGTQDYLRGKKFDPHQAFNDGLDQVAVKLGVKPGLQTTPRAVFDKLEQTGSVLFVLNSELIPQDGGGDLNRMLALLQVASRSGSRRRGRLATMCLVGNTPDIVMNKYGVSAAADVTSALTTAAAARAETHAKKAQVRTCFFKKEFRRFSIDRGAPFVDDVGPRTKWAEWYYSSIVHNVFPVHIRLRAFLASNFRSQAYFDPTGGWNRMAGMPVHALPIDIRLALDETVAHARGVARPLSIAEERALRWISTTVYWLKADTVADLARQTRKGSAKTFDETAATMNRMVRNGGKADTGESLGPVAPETIYKLSLALRAVIQERWMHRAPGERALCHHVVAKKLWNSQGDKSLLKTEFPLGSRWGRSRLIFQSETIRQLMRICATAPEGPSAAPAFPACDFPALPDGDIVPTDPGEIVNFCFGRIFWTMMNRNKPTGFIHNRKLGRKHGLYGLAAEMLELMSRDGKLGEPHWALHKDHHPRYFREVAYAQLDIGDLDGAQRNFERLVELADVGGQTLARISYRLDLVVALTTRDDLAAAADILFEADRLRLELVASDPSANQGGGEGNSGPKWMRKLDVRIRARQADLHYLMGDQFRALRMFNDLERDYGPDVITLANAHSYIAALGAVGDGMLGKARHVAAAKRQESNAKGFHHEELGFRIALAHVWRRLGYPLDAEQELNSVYADILKEGCSERTYLAFLLEAGRLLAKQERHTRAYAAYFRPCLERAAALGYRRAARKALELAIESLDGIPGEVAACNIPGDWQTKTRKLADWQGDEIAARRRRKDPRYTVGIIPPGKWLPRVCSEAALAEELRCLKEMSLEGVPREMNR